VPDSWKEWTEFTGFDHYDCIRDNEPVYIHDGIEHNVNCDHLWWYISNIDSYLWQLESWH
jgi:hypothetical protein